MACAPITENFIESDFTGTPSPESGFESHGTPVSVEKAQFQDVFVSQTQSPQVKSEFISHLFFVYVITRSGDP